LQLSEFLVQISCDSYATCTETAGSEAQNTILEVTSLQWINWQKKYKNPSRCWESRSHLRSWKL